MAGVFRFLPEFLRGLAAITDNGDILFTDMPGSILFRYPQNINILPPLAVSHFHCVFFLIFLKPHFKIILIIFSPSFNDSYKIFIWVYILLFIIKTWDDFVFHFFPKFSELLFFSWCFCLCMGFHSFWDFSSRFFFISSKSRLSTGNFTWHAIVEFSASR